MTGPALAADVTATAWLPEDLDVGTGQTVAEWVPGGFEAIARIAHPDEEEGGPPLELMNRMIPLLSRHTEDADRCWFGIWDGWFWLNEFPLMVAGQDERGRDISGNYMPAPAFEEKARARATYRGPSRDFILFEGPLRSVSRLGWDEGKAFAESPQLGVPPDSFEYQAPQMCWPNDHAWFFSSDTDIEWTYLGGSEALIDEVTAELPGARVVRPNEPSD